jgi:hypothetical protein
MEKICHLQPDGILTDFSLSSVARLFAGTISHHLYVSGAFKKEMPLHDIKHRHKWPRAARQEHSEKKQFCPGGPHASHRAFDPDRSADGVEHTSFCRASVAVWLHGALGRSEMRVAHVSLHLPMAGGPRDHFLMPR